MMRYVMAIDLKRCVGCHTCSVACKMANNLPNEIWWRILTVGGEAMDTAAGTFPNNTLEYLPVNCQHCANPACVKPALSEPPINGKKMASSSRIMINASAVVTAWWLAPTAEFVNSTGRNLNTMWILR